MPEGVAETEFGVVILLVWPQPQNRVVTDFEEAGRCRDSGGEAEARQGARRRRAQVTVRIGARGGRPVCGEEATWQAERGGGDENAPRLEGEGTISLGEDGSCTAANFVLERVAVASVPGAGEFLESEGGGAMNLEQIEWPTLLQG